MQTLAFLPHTRVAGASRSIKRTRGHMASVKITRTRALACQAMQQRGAYAHVNTVGASHVCTYYNLGSNQRSRSKRNGEDEKLWGSPTELSTNSVKDGNSICPMLGARCIVATLQLQCVLGLFNEVTRDYGSSSLSLPNQSGGIFLLTLWETLPTLFQLLISLTALLRSVLPG